MIHVIRNLLCFKIGWIACVLFAAAGKPVFAAISVAVVAAVHLISVNVPMKELLLLATAALMGLVWESFMVWSGLVSYPGHTALMLAPLWIVAMWVLFATTINHGLSWTKRSWWMASLAGLLGGPMAFYGGMNIGAVEFNNTATALLAIGAGWAVLLPALVRVADYIIDIPWLETETGPDAKQAMTSGAGS